MKSVRVLECCGIEPDLSGDTVEVPAALRRWWRRAAYPFPDPDPEPEAEEVVVASGTDVVAALPLGLEDGVEEDPNLHS